MRPTAYAVTNHGTSESLIGLRVWLTASPWQIRPAWATLAGALAAGAIPWRQRDAILLLLAVFLADAMWGSVWNLLGSSALVMGEGTGEVTTVSPFPYTQRGSPAARFLAWIGGAVGQAWRDGLVAWAWALFLASLMSDQAVVLTCTVGVMAVLTRGLSAGHLLRRLAAGLINLGLPWAMGLSLFGAWSERAVLLACAFTILVAATRDVVLKPLMALAQVAIVALLILWRLPLAAGFVGLALWPSLLWVTQDASGLPLDKRVGSWWLAALLASAWTMR